MAQIAGDEKNDVAVTNQPGEHGPEGDNECKVDDYSKLYSTTVEIDSNKKEVKLEVQNKQTRQLFRGVYPMSTLNNGGFASQYSLQDIKKVLESAFNKEENLHLTIS